jgi:two-component system, OmpR family, phosphate regulon sensor histidine kinase PhoR
MSRKRTAIETIIASLAIILVYSILAVIIFLASSDATANRLKTNATIAERIFDGSDASVSGKQIESYFTSTDANDIRVSVITQDDQGGYTIVYDSMGMYKAENTPTELENLGKIVTRKSSYGYNMIYYAVKDSQVPSYYLRTAVKESTSTALSRGFLIHGTITMVILVAVYVGYQVYRYKKDIQPLKEQIQKLVLISGDSSSLTDQDDVAALSLAVKKVSNKLDNEITQLKDEQQKTQTILDSISQGFLALSGDGKIVLINKAATTIFSYQEKEALGNDYHVLDSDETFTQAVDAALLFRKESEPFDLTFEGRIYQVSIMTLTFSWNEESQAGIAILILDVTGERKLAQIKNDFFTNASHELKSPLTSILGYQEMIASGIISDPKDVQDAVNKTVLEAKRMRDILSDMLVLNKLENGEKKTIVPVKVDEVIQAIADNLKPQALAKGVTVTLELSPLTIQADKEDIQRLFTNLIDNAIKYNKPNGTLLVSLQDQKVSVKDTGIGIKEENLSRIFERFYRVDNSRLDTTIEGSGLGLAIVKHICEANHYKLAVKSVYGQGSTFSVELH